MYKAPHSGLHGEDRMWVEDELYPGLMVSRSLGDIVAHRIGSLEIPDTNVIKLKESDEFIVLGSDGLWDVLSNQEVCDIVSNYQKAPNLACKVLLSKYFY